MTKEELQKKIEKLETNAVSSRENLNKVILSRLACQDITVDAPSAAKIAEAKKQAEALADRHFVADTDDVISAMGEIKALTKEIEPPNDGGLTGSYLAFFYVQKMGGLKVNKYRELLDEG